MPRWNLRKFAFSIMVTLVMLGSLTILGCSDDDEKGISATGNATALNNREFTFPDGSALATSLAVNQSVTLAFFGFANDQDTTGTFVLGSVGAPGSARGNVILGSCAFLIETSSYAIGRGPQEGEELVYDPCEIEIENGKAIELRLTDPDTGDVTTSTSVRDTGSSGG